MNTIRIPIKFNPSTFAMETITENTDEYFANLIGFALQMEPKSLPISTFYGIPDPTFETNKTVLVAKSVGTLIPEVRITEVNSIPNVNGEVNLSIKFERVS